MNYKNPIQMKTILIFFVIYFLPHLIKAQTFDLETAKVNWKVNQVTNKDNASDQFQSHSEFITHDINTIKWVQKGGAKVYEFDVIERTGSWHNSDADGELIYSVTFRGNAGTIKFSRKQSVITIDTHVPVNGKNILPYVFQVNSISQL